MESFVIGFSKKYPLIPVELYGKLSHLVRPLNGAHSLTQTEQSEQPNAQPQSAKKSQSESWTEVRSQKQSRLQTRSQPQPQSLPSQHCQQQSQDKSQECPKLKILLSKGPDGDWSQNPGLPRAAAGPDPGNSQVMPVSKLNQNSNVKGVASVAEGVSSFLSGIRATFRQDNVNVSASTRPNKFNDVKN